MRRTRKSKPEILAARQEIQNRAAQGKLVFPSAIREMREALDMTQAEFARTFRMTRQQVVALESGKTNPTLETLNKILLPFRLTLGVVPMPAKLGPEAQRRFIVIDQNAMRRSLLKDMLERQDNVAFIIPEIAMMEMSKTERWRETMVGSFRPLLGVLQQTYLAVDLGEALREEQKTGLPIDRTRLLPLELTTGMRQLVEDLTSTERATSNFVTRWESQRVQALASYLDTAGVKERRANNVLLLEAACGDRMAKDVRSNRLGREAQLGLIYEQAMASLRRDYSYLGEKAVLLANSKSLHFRMICLEFRYALWWSKRRGVENARPEALLNDSFDRDYVLTASFFDGILTQDKAMIETEKDLRDLLDDSKVGTFEAALRDYRRNTIGVTKVHA